MVAIAIVAGLATLFHAFLAGCVTVACRGEQDKAVKRAMFGTRKALRWAFAWSVISCLLAAKVIH